MPDNKSGQELGSPLSKRLDAMIRLLMDQQLADGRLQRGDQLIILDSVGLSSGEIGRIMGRPSKDIASWLRRLKAKGDRTSKEKEDIE